jgi:purine-binding chemotaxis protein CheW
MSEQDPLTDIDTELGGGVSFGSFFDELLATQGVDIEPAHPAEAPPSGPEVTGDQLAVVETLAMLGQIAREAAAADPRIAGNGPALESAAAQNTPPAEDIAQALSALDSHTAETRHDAPAPPSMHVENLTEASRPRVSIFIPNPKFAGPATGEPSALKPSGAHPIPAPVHVEAIEASVTADSEPVAFDVVAAAPISISARSFPEEDSSTTLPSLAALELVPEVEIPELARLEAPAGAVPSEPVAEIPGEQLGQILRGVDASLDEQLASKIAQPAAKDQTSAEWHTCIVFNLNGSAYGIKIGSVLEMDTVPRITAVPNVPEFVSGVTNLRGEVLPVLNLRCLLGLPLQDQVDRGRILVVRTSKGDQSAVLLVDEVRGTTAVGFRGLEKPMEQLSDPIVPLLHGVSSYQEQVLNVLDLDKLFEVPDVRNLRS